MNVVCLIDLLGPARVLLICRVMKEQCPVARGSSCLKGSTLCHLFSFSYPQWGERTFVLKLGAARCYTPRHSHSLVVSFPVGFAMTTKKHYVLLLFR